MHTIDRVKFASNEAKTPAQRRREQGEQPRTLNEQTLRELEAYRE